MVQFTFLIAIIVVVVIIAILLYFILTFGEKAPQVILSSTYKTFNDVLGFIDGCTEKSLQGGEESACFKEKGCQICEIDISGSKVDICIAKWRTCPQ